MIVHELVRPGCRPSPVLILQPDACTEMWSSVCDTALTSSVAGFPPYVSRFVICLKNRILYLYKKCFARMRERFGKQPDFFSLAGMELPDQPVFVDSGHMNALGNKSVAQALLHVLGPKIEAMPAISATEN